MPGLQRSNCDTARRGGRVPARRRVHRGPVRGEPALRRAGSSCRPRRDDHGDARARDRVLRDHVRDRSVRDGGYDVRIFTPDAELPFAGHPTLGTAFTLASEGRVGTEPRADVGGRRRPGRGRRSAAGTAWMQPAPSVVRRTDRRSRRPSPARRGWSRSDLVDGLPVVAGSTGLAHLMVPVRDEAALRRARRDDAGCGRVCADAEAESLYLFAVRGDGDVMARMFDRGANIGEDPATGSAAGPLGAYLARASARRAARHGRRRAGRDGGAAELPPRRGATAAASSFSVRVGGGVRIVGDGDVPARR